MFPRILIEKILIDGVLLLCKKLLLLLQYLPEKSFKVNSRDSGFKWFDETLYKMRGNVDLLNEIRVIRIVVKQEAQNNKNLNDQ